MRSIFEYPRYVVAPWILRDMGKRESVKQSCLSHYGLFEPECSAEADFEGQVEEDEATEECRGESQEDGPSDDVVMVIFIYRALGWEAVEIV